jgi:DNA-binding response OmpR family regulator
MPKPKPRLLIVDDDRELASLLLEILELDGYRVDIAADGETALQRLTDDQPDLLILDVMLPGMDGFQVLKKVRKDHDLPVIMLTARGDESERIHGLTSGADDYIPKPFNPIELAARIHNVLRRSVPAEQPLEELTAGPITLDRKRRKLFLHNTEVKLTAAELRVLEQLMQRSGEVLSRAHLTELALNRPLEAYDRSIDTLISKMRKKLADAGLEGNCIRSLRGHGYVFDMDIDKP